MATILIGIDDTDTQESPGTGKLARQLAMQIEHNGGKHVATTGHQFLIDPAIPYTGHNRGICLAINWTRPLGQLEFVFDSIQAWSAEGSDPGVCIMNADEIPSAVIKWGRRALTTVLEMNDAIAIACVNHLSLRALGGTGQGIIGALASVGLRASGESGRFVDMPGLRELPEVVTAAHLQEMGIEIEYNTVRDMKPTVSTIKTLGWIRPRLSRGKPVLSVDWSDHDNAWIPVDRKKVHPVE